MYKRLRDSVIRFNEWYETTDEHAMIEWFTRQWWFYPYLIGVLSLWAYALLK